MRVANILERDTRLGGSDEQARDLRDHAVPEARIELVQVLADFAAPANGITDDVMTR